MPPITLKRAYEAPSDDDGARVLVDRIWPRGVKKADLRIDAWLKDLAPSTPLRKWFDHDPARWDEFRARYHAELAQQPDGLQRLLAMCRDGPVTLVFAAKDTEHSNATALKIYLEQCIRTQDCA